MSALFKSLLVLQAYHRGILKTQTMSRMFRIPSQQRTGTQLIYMFRLTLDYSAVHCVPACKSKVHLWSLESKFVEYGGNHIFMSKAATRVAACGFAESYSPAYLGIASRHL